jgi:gluconolactonase
VDSQGNVYLVNVQSNHVNKVSADGAVSVFSQWDGAHPNGSCFDHEGRLLVCDSGNKQIVRLDKEGKVEVISRDPRPGEHYRGPNDICIDQHGRIYFTDPGDFKAPSGAIYRLDPDGHVTKLDSPLHFANGIAVDREAHWLYVAQTPLKRIDRYELDDAGNVGPRQAWAQLEDAGTGPDGMRFDRDGFLYYAHFGLGKIVKLDPHGEKVEELDAGGHNPTNLSFGPIPGAADPRDRTQWRCIYITEAQTHQLTYQIVETPGVELP